jgi:hypothetical protein
MTILTNAMRIKEIEGRYQKCDNSVTRNDLKILRDFYEQMAIYFKDTGILNAHFTSQQSRMQRHLDAIDESDGR